MLLIRKNQSNSLTLTLTEKCDLANPYFLFKFHNVQTGQDIFKILTDTSQFTDRYNRFTFVEPTTADLIEGFWDYEVYEQASSVNLDPEGLNMVESGVMKVVNEATPVTGTVYEGEQTERAVYP